MSEGGPAIGAGERGVLNFPASRTLYSRFLLLQFFMGFRLFALVLLLLQHMTQRFEILSYFSRLPPPWVSRSLLSLFPPPLHFRTKLVPQLISVVSWSEDSRHRNFQRHTFNSSHPRSQGFFKLRRGKTELWDSSKAGFYCVIKLLPNSLF